MVKTTRRQFLMGLGAAGLLAGSARAEALLKLANDKRLNILFIMTDDHAAHAISAYGSKVNKTPNLDRLAKEGMIFNKVLCTNPICTPSRAGILTGRYSHKNGVPVFNDLSPEIETVGGYMRRAGYYTAFIGKWHCGGTASVRDADWDKWMIYQGQGQYFDPWFWERNNEGKVVRHDYPGEYATENITRVTQDVISKGLETGKPFYVMMHHKAPHRNWLPSKKYHDKFRALTLEDIPVPSTLFDKWEGRASAIKTTAMTLLRHMRPGADLKLAEFFSEGHTFTFEGKTWQGKRDAQGMFVDDWPEGMTDRDKTALSYLRYMQDYLACVQSVDDSVGEMLDFLDKKGVGDNTLVIYTADQGFFLGDHGLYDKRFIMEETVKMPFLARCPAIIKPGSVNDDIIANIDFAPTFLDIASLKTPSEMQGRSFLANLQGKTSDDWPQECYCRYYVEGGEHATAAWYGVVTKIDKLVYYYKRDEWEYFDLVADPDELDNRYSDPAKARRIATLKDLIKSLREKYGDEDQFINCHEYSL